jgi:hypothetical protein
MLFENPRETDVSQIFIVGIGTSVPISFLVLVDKSRSETLDKTMFTIKAGQP